MVHVRNVLKGHGVLTMPAPRKPTVPQRCLRATTDSTVADRVVESVLPARRTVSSPRSLPLAELAVLPRDVSMLYGMGRIDASGRISERSIVREFGWTPGERLDVRKVSQAVVFCSDPDGPYSLTDRSCLAVPAALRVRCGLAAGDRVFLAAAPQHGVLVVHTLAALDEMVLRYHASLGGEDE